MTYAQTAYDEFRASDGIRVRSRPYKITKKESQAIVKARSPSLQKLARMATDRNRDKHWARFFTDVIWEHTFTGLAECGGLDAELFFPERGASTKAAKAVCAECPIRLQCLEYALDASIKFGIWGGTSERERRRLRKLYLAGKKVKDIAPVLKSNYGAYEAVMATKSQAFSQPISKRLMTYLAPYGSTGLRTNSGESVFRFISLQTNIEITRLRKAIRYLKEAGLIEYIWHTTPNGLSYAMGIKLTDTGRGLFVLEPIKTKAQPQRKIKDQEEKMSQEISYELQKLCKTLAEHDGVLLDSGGLCATLIKKMGFPYNHRTLPKQAEDAGLVEREIRGKRTFKIELTEAGWEVAQSTTLQASQPTDPDDVSTQTDWFPAKITPVVNEELDTPQADTFATSKASVVVQPDGTEISAGFSTQLTSLIEQALAGAIKQGISECVAELEAAIHQLEAISHSIDDAGLASGNGHSRLSSELIALVSQLGQPKALSS